MDVVKKLELTQEDAQKLYLDGKYIVNGRHVYELVYDGLFKSKEVYMSKALLPLVARGRWLAVTAENVNRIVGFKLIEVVE